MRGPENRHPWGAGHLVRVSRGQERHHNVKTRKNEQKKASVAPGKNISVRFSPLQSPDPESGTEGRHSVFWRIRGTQGRKRTACGPARGPQTHDTLCVGQSEEHKGGTVVPVRDPPAGVGETRCVHGTVERHEHRVGQPAHVPASTPSPPVEPRGHPQSLIGTPNRTNPAKRGSRSMGEALGTLTR